MTRDQSPPERTHGHPGGARRIGTFVAAGLLGGLLSGLLGIGGGVVIVPILALGLGFAQKRAQGTSLVAILLTAASGAVSYALAGEIAYVPAAAIAIGGVAGTFVGAALLHRMSDNQARIVFAVLMVVVAVRMAWGVEVSGGEESVDLTPLVVLGFVLAGLAMGTLSALVGVGGGIVLVPMLILIFLFTPQTAQGTSLLVMIPIALLGALRNARNGYTDWAAGAAVGLGGVLAAPVGGLIALAVPGTVLQRIFAALLAFSAWQLIRKALGSART